MEYEYVCYVFLFEAPWEIFVIRELLHEDIEEAGCLLPLPPSLNQLRKLKADGVWLLIDSSSPTSLRATYFQLA